MPNERPGDFLRDEWLESMGREAERRGWGFKAVYTWFGPVGNLKDNNSFGVDTARATFPALFTDEARTDSSSIIRGLLHASANWGAWAISLEHVQSLEKNLQDTGERYIVVLLDRKCDTGFILSRDQILSWVLEGSSDGKIEVQRADLERAPYFASIAECADQIVQPIPFRLTTAMPGPGVEIRCGIHGNNKRYRGGAWVCLQCDGSPSGAP